MNSHRWFVLKIWIRKSFILAGFYILSSVIYTLFSTVGIRNRFPLIVTLFYHPNLLGTTMEVSAMEVAKQRITFQRPRLVEENKVLEFPAVVEPTKEILLHVKQSGLVRKIYVQEGDCVKEGQILLEIDDELIRLEGEKLRISLEIAESQVNTALQKWKQAERQVEVKLREIDKKTEWIDLAEKEWALSQDLKDKKIILWKQGFVSFSEIEKLKQEEESKHTQYNNLIRDRENLLSGINLDLQVETFSFEDKLKIWKEKNTSLERSEYELSLSHLKIIENQIKSNKQLLADTRLRAPKPGKILKIHAKEGELTNQIPVMTLMEKGELSVGFQISELDLPHVSSGKGVIFLLSQEDLPKIPGKVDRVGGFLDPRSHSIGIKVRLETKQTIILPGMFGIVQVKLPETVEKILISSTSLRGDEVSGFYVNVKEGVGIKKRFIQFKPYKLNELEIVSGLSPEDEIESELPL